jgi:DNA polymerase-4
MGRSGELPRGLLEQYRVTHGNVLDDAGCPILHVDIDAFFAAVEIRERPELVGCPVVVGGTGNRGVVSSASYPAREFGVCSAMPMARARTLCPHAAFLPPSFELYREVSRGMRAIFAEITPVVEPTSLDEAFLNVAGALRRTSMTAAGLGAWIRARVAAEQAVTCSVGVGPTKFVAKLASGMCKPDGEMVVPADSVLDFLRPLPVSALWGVGSATAARLAELGLETVADLAGTGLYRLRRLLGVAAAEHLHALAHGRDERPVVAEAPERSIGAEETFDTDQDDRAVLRRELLRLSERTGSALRARGLRGRRVSIKVRFGDFHTITRSRTLPAGADALDGTQVIYRLARSLLDDETPPGPIRLIGVRLERLAQRDGAGTQLRLEVASDDRGGGSGWRAVDAAADAARTRFGGVAVLPAALLASAPARPSRGHGKAGHRTTGPSSPGEGVARPN